ncbi:MAG: hypothetical protein ACKO6N_05060, partial [Myxococcota bacterium]
MKKLSSLLALSACFIAGCGPTADDIIGTWTFDEGSVLKNDCGDGSTTETKLAGDTMTFAAGTEFDLIVDDGGDCLTGYSFDGTELKQAGTEGTCETEEPSDSVTTTGEYIWTYVAEGETAKLVASGSVTVEDTEFGYSCTSE